MDARCGVRPGTYVAGPVSGQPINVQVIRGRDFSLFTSLRMRAFVVKENCHPSKIDLSSDVPEPKLAADEVLIDVYSAGLNFFDVR